MMAAAEDDSSSSEDTSTTTSEEESSSKDPSPVEEPKPPPLPRRAINFYIRTNFAKAKKELGRDQRSSDVFRLLSERWLELSTVLRQPFEHAAQVDLARYKKQKAEYERAYSKWSGSNRRPPIRKRKRKSDAPRRPKSTFKFFVEANWKKAEKRALEKVTTNSDPKKEIRRLLRRHWNKTDEDRREKYLKMHEQDVGRYKREMAEVQRQEKRKRRDILRKLGYTSSESSDEESEEPKNIGRFCGLQ